MNLNCPFCLKEIQPDNKFCPHCGKQLPTQNTTFSSWQKVKIYLITIFIAPFGLYWFFKYRKDANDQKRQVAYMTLYITIAVVVLIIGANIWLYKALLQYMNIAEKDFGVVGLY